MCLTNLNFSKWLKDGQERTALKIKINSFDIIDFKDKQESRENYTPPQKKQDDYYDNTDFNDAPIDKYDPFDEDVPF